MSNHDFFNLDEFQDPMRGMAEEAIRRMDGIREGNINGMLEGDVYMSEILEREWAYGRVSADTVLGATIIDPIDDALLQMPLPPDYFTGTLSQIGFALHEHAYVYGRNWAARYIPDAEKLKDRISEAWIMGEKARRERRKLELLTADLGSMGITKLSLDYDEPRAVWTAGFEARLARSYIFIN